MNTFKQSEIEILKKAGTTLHNIPKSIGWLCNKVFQNLFRRDMMKEVK